ncbi:hypothetical protein [Pseudomonas fluorescens]|uniref:Uncharacterized protein n=1 Tax=Pseudomonas fluorescens TaxID=294 RepID=A0A0F4V5N5_PSEFL|nr:hypothetical protein [Pseudomonas fluorescens]KJZ64163.1 hypothetical protein VD17_19205 [Pseudomonas fluorescens]
MNATLQASSNGHLTIDFGDLPETDWETLENKLIEVWGFRRVGSVVIGLDEKIYPSFQRSDLTLATGWDIWSGHYVLSECAAGDGFLRKLFNELHDRETSPPI